MGRSVALNLTFPERVTPSGAPGRGFLRFFGGVFVGFGMGHEKRVFFFIVFFLGVDMDIYIYDMYMYLFI